MLGDYRHLFETLLVAREIERTRARCRDSMALLKAAAKVDTFLARKTQEPFPLESVNVADVVKRYSQGWYES